MSYDVGHLIGNAYWQLCETFFLKFFLKIIIGLQSSFLQLYCLQLFKSELAWFFTLVSLGVNDYPWEIAIVWIWSLTYMVLGFRVSISPLLLFRVCHMTWLTSFLVIRSHRLQIKDSLY